MTEDVLSSYAPPAGRSLAKEITELDEYCRDFLALCPFAVLSSATAGGQPDVAPRGGAPGFLRVLDSRTLLLPDRLGNNRLDSLRKIAANPRVALLCLVPGFDDTLRIYGRADLRTVAESPVAVTEHGRQPRSVMVIHVEKAFMHCAKALMRARLWDPDARVPRQSFASTGEVLRAHSGAAGPAETQDDMRRRYESQL
ncbi:MAG: pyridoxamine 5'-phosphate oxidase family protein [Pseudonocardiales bacterium]|nr:pyridoxamine 5'-phosphate oxidase family protein [Pseudonocardiales bacterium]